MGKLIIMFLLLGLMLGGYWFFIRDVSADVKCNNTVLDDGEEDIDCGGDCPPCPTCMDEIQNGQEEGVDCGGPDCPECMSAPSCDDGILNQDEIGVDCGGVCPECDKITCNVFNNSINFTITGWTLDKPTLKKRLLNVTVDKIYLDPERPAYPLVDFDCKWGQDIGEQVHLYYCYANYTAPRLKDSELDEKTITGYIFKVFKVGMDVYRYTSEEKKYTKFAFMEVNSSCYQAEKPELTPEH